MSDSTDTTPTTPTASDRVYFRQLLAGRDFAKNDPIARQMVNFVYAIGDRESGEAVVVDPASDWPRRAEEWLRARGLLAPPPAKP